MKTPRLHSHAKFTPFPTQLVQKISTDSCNKKRFNLASHNTSSLHTHPSRESPLPKAILKELKSGNLSPKGFLQQELLHSNLTETHLPSQEWPLPKLYWNNNQRAKKTWHRTDSHKQEMLQSKLTAKTSPLYNSFPARESPLSKLYWNNNYSSKTCHRMDSYNKKCFNSNVTQTFSSLHTFPLTRNLPFPTCIIEQLKSGSLQVAANERSPARLAQELWRNISFIHPTWVSRSVGRGSCTHSKYLSPQQG